MRCEEEREETSNGIARIEINITTLFRCKEKINNNFLVVDATKYSESKNVAHDFSNRSGSNWLMRPLRPMRPARCLRRGVYLFFVL